ncbi:uncharacterized protein LOC128821235 [Vidua macroura]|uniref:uncharacterized protein LOC128821235 n=1 Tax=Vidua macroura TaxID=187451 RepID=UPI0023A7F6FD|nr:uncharacterized protein LOC128821235 [Vidua macroura]
MTSSDPKLPQVNLLKASGDIKRPKNGVKCPKVGGSAWLTRAAVLPPCAQSAILQPFTKALPRPPSWKCLGWDAFDLLKMVLKKIKREIRIRSPVSSTATRVPASGKLAAKREEGPRDDTKWPFSASQPSDHQGGRVASRPSPAVQRSHEDGLRLFRRTGTLNQGNRRVLRSSVTISLQDEDLTRVPAGFLGPLHNCRDTTVLILEDSFNTPNEITILPEATLDKTIKAIKAAGLQIAEEKIQFSAPWRYLGFLITGRTVTPQTLTINEDPKTLRDLQQLRRRPRLTARADTCRAGSPATGCCCSEVSPGTPRGPDPSRELHGVG